MVTILCKILILPSFLLVILVWVLAAIYYFTCWALCQYLGSIDSTGKHTEHPTSFLIDYESSGKNENSFLQTLSPATRNAAPWRYKPCRWAAQTVEQLGLEESVFEGHEGTKLWTEILWVEATSRRRICVALLPQHLGTVVEHIRHGHRLWQYSLLKAIL